MPNEVASAREQEYKLEVAFGRHLREKHPEDFSQAAARIVGEVTKDQPILRRASKACLRTSAMKC
jgi:hypothetical protein